MSISDSDDRVICRRLRALKEKKRKLGLNFSKKEIDGEFYKHTSGVDKDARAVIINV